MDEEHKWRENFWPPPRADMLVNVHLQAQARLHESFGAQARAEISACAQIQCNLHHSVSGRPNVSVKPERLCRPETQWRACCVWDAHHDLPPVLAHNEAADLEVNAAVDGEPPLKVVGNRQGALEDEEGVPEDRICAVMSSAGCKELCQSSCQVCGWHYGKWLQAGFPAAAALQLRS